MSKRYIQTNLGGSGLVYLATPKSLYHEPAKFPSFYFRTDCRKETVSPDMDKNVLDFLKKSHVHIKDWVKVKDKIQSLITGRQNKLQVVADFDFTLTKFHNNGHKIPSTYSVMESYSNWPMEYKEAIRLLKSKYHEIDNDPLRTIKEKTPLLLDLLRDAFKIMQCSRLQESNFKSMVEESSIQFREGVEGFFEDLNKANIPVLIISAGLGNIIIEVLSKHSLLKNNLKVIANHVKYYQIDDGITDAVTNRQFVHPYNKDIISSRLSDSYFENLSHCKNMILLGDSLGDLHMSCGAAVNTLLTIGFLNEKIEQSLANYTEHFDIVLVDDQTFNVPNSLIKLVVG